MAIPAAGIAIRNMRLTHEADGIEKRHSSPNGVLTV
jgi:hypothetical protein